MDIVSYCPLRVAALPFQTSQHTHALLVVCKATYLLTPGTSVLHENQEDVNDEDNYWDDDPRRSVYSPGDLVPQKRGADVVLVGHAFAPNDAPVRSIVARLCVGELDKSIEVFCDRHFTPSGDLREGPRVSRLRLRYERAAGGPGTTNPVGMPLDHRDAFGSIKLPNLQPTGRHVTRPEDIEPIGYGPIAPSWPTRQSRLGHLAGHVDATRWYEAPLPDGLDPLFFNVAPRDQEIPEIRPDERIVLEGLHPEHARLVTNLPGIRPRAVIERPSGRAEEIPLTADTLWFDTTRGICTLVFRGRTPIAHPAEAGRVVVTLAGQTFAGAHPAPMYPPAGDPDEPPAETLTMSLAEVREAQRAIMPFSPSSVAVPPPRESGVYAAERPLIDDEEVTFVGTDVPSADPLPFRAAPPPATPFAPRDLPFTSPLAPPPIPPAPARVPSTPRDLPFASPLAPPAPASPEPSRARTPSRHDLPFTSPLAPPPVPPAAAVPPPHVAPPPVVSPPQPVSPPAVVPPQIAPPPQVAPPPIVPRLGMAPLGAPLGVPLSSTPAPAPSRASSAPQAPAPAPSPAAPPPVQDDTTVDTPAMIGPLATAEMAARAATSPEPEPEPEPPPPAAPAPEPEPPAPALPLEAYPIERCAKITASIARRRAERAEILEAEELDLALWTDLDKHWADAIREETERGKTNLLKAFDAAYVARLEEERGPITPADYARMVVAGERGRVERTLADLGLPRGAPLRIEREFLARSAADPSLGERLRLAVDVERSG